MWLESAQTKEGNYVKDQAVVETVCSVNLSSTSPDTDKNQCDVSAINLILSSEKIPRHIEWDFIEYNLDNDKKGKDLFRIFG